MKDENFLILHGTADGESLFNLTLRFGIHCKHFFNFSFQFLCFAKARVHFQHSAELLSRLVKVEANYSLQLYPDEGHILRESRSIQHFQRTVVNYLQNCLRHSTLLDTIEEEEEEDD